MDLFEKIDLFEKMSAQLSGDDSNELESFNKKSVQYRTNMLKLAQEADPAPGAGLRQMNAPAERERSMTPASPEATNDPKDPRHYAKVQAGKIGFIQQEQDLSGANYYLLQGLNRILENRSLTGEANTYEGASDLTPDQFNKIVATLKKAMPDLQKGWTMLNKIVNQPPLPTK